MQTQTEKGLCVTHYLRVRVNTQPGGAVRRALPMGNARRPARPDSDGPESPDSQNVGPAQIFLTQKM